MIRELATSDGGQLSALRSDHFTPYRNLKYMGLRDGMGVTVLVENEPHRPN